VSDRLSGVPDPRVAAATLTRTFLRRFFDNEITGGTQDLTLSFFWLIGFLAAPLALMPVTFIVRYREIVLTFGPDALRILSRTDKTRAIAFGMAAAALLAAVVWDSLMLERRDGLILGGLPVRGRTIVLSKLAALAIYVLGISAAMHAFSALAFGVMLSDGSTSARLTLLSPVAHFTAAVAGCAFVFLVVTASQGIALAVAGPAVFRRVSQILQVALIASIVIGLTQLPAVLGGVAGFNQIGPNPPPASWVWLAPPVWFLGLDEWILGGAEPIYRTLALTALFALAVVSVVTIGTYAGVYRQVMIRAAEMPEDSIGARRVSAAFEWITRRLSRDPRPRAAAQFFFASLGRVQRLRFVVAVTIGLVCAWVVPALIALGAGGDRGAAPQATFTLSYAAMLILVGGLRIAISLPADLRAAWIVPMIDAPGRTLRSGVWRALFAVAVVPVTLCFAVFHAWSLGPPFALMHAGVMLGVGGLFVELALWHFDGMSNQRPWRPEHGNLRLWWPAYLLAFSTVTAAIPEIEVLADESLAFNAAIAGVCLLVAVVVRVWHSRPYAVPSFEIESFVEAPSVLKLN
jgi:hypothetical protein